MDAPNIDVAQLRDFLNTLSPADFQRFMRDVKGSFEISSTGVNPTHPAPSLPNPSHQSVLRPTNSGNRITKSTKVSGNATLRPLNSWMAFRTYYSGIFANLPQKDISGMLKVLWKEDPCKTKWTTMAKAYSEIRDKVGKDKAPLNQFLLIACNFLGICEPNMYMWLYGWAVVGENGTRTVQRLGPIRAHPEHMIVLTSVEDLKEQCRLRNYAGLYPDEALANTDELSTGPAETISEEISSEYIENSAAYVEDEDINVDNDLLDNGDVEGDKNGDDGSDEEGDDGSDEDRDNDSDDDEDVDSSDDEDVDSDSNDDEEEEDSRTGLRFEPDPEIVFEPTRASIPFAPPAANPLVTNPLVANPVVANPLVTDPVVAGSVEFDTSVALLLDEPNPDSIFFPTHGQYAMTSGPDVSEFLEGDLSGNIASSMPEQNTTMDAGYMNPFDMDAEAWWNLLPIENEEGDLILNSFPHDPFEAWTVGM